MLLPSDFIRAANLPDRWQERDLQAYLFSCLQSRGFSVRDEVRLNGGRADLVSDYLGGSIVEVKKYLDRDTIYQAAGQLLVYGQGNNRKLVIAGFLTTDASKIDSARTTANLVCQDKRYAVIFVNLQPEWFPGAKQQKQWGAWFIPNIRLPSFNSPQVFGFAMQLIRKHPFAALLILLVGFAAFQAPPDQPTRPNQERSFLRWN